jgi:hypothetical protein
VCVEREHRGRWDAECSISWSSQFGLRHTAKVVKREGEARLVGAEVGALVLRMFGMRTVVRSSWRRAAGRVQCRERVRQAHSSTTGCDRLRLTRAGVMRESHHSLPDPRQQVVAPREQVSILPPSLELLRKVEVELAAIGMLEDEAAVRYQVAALNVEIAKINATVADGPPTRLTPLNVDQVVAQWQPKRSC